MCTALEDARAGPTVRTPEDAAPTQWDGFALLGRSSDDVGSAFSGRGSSGDFNGSPTDDPEGDGMGGTDLHPEDDGLGWRENGIGGGSCTEGSGATAQSRRLDLSDDDGFGRRGFGGGSWTEDPWMDDPGTDESWSDDDLQIT